MNDTFIGLISGTSMDGVDAALVDFQDGVPPRLLAHHALPMPAELRRELLAVARPGADDLDRVARLDNAVALAFVQAVKALLDKGNRKADSVAAIGSHGQTVRHIPEGTEPYTVQLGNPSLIAELTGITTVADFRRRDMAAGGQGAPLAPAFHAAFFSAAREDRAVVNIGGIANITLLPAQGEIRGFDTGPGNVLLDGWAQRHLDQPLDLNGVWGTGGQPDPTLLKQCLGDRYFALSPPKSTGREYFHLDWLDRQLSTITHPIAPQDVQATLVELTACTIAGDLQRQQPGSQRLLVCGGGVRNPALLEALGRALPAVEVISCERYGMDPDYLEAIGFAWLARRTLLGLPGNLPTVTGARGPRILGGIYPA
ncbi:MAG: anhydro-N-acetylmuramic acid kinase [Candidatus Competibacteraceae bacterium]|nr:anhydro-N-acetylmuramic acid kinase [Candidatus Competibacteraceae bacterium]